MYESSNFKIKLDSKSLISMFYIKIYPKLEPSMLNFAQVAQNEKKNRLTKINIKNTQNHVFSFRIY